MKCARGFSLIEVLVALSVLALSLTAVAQSVKISLETTKQTVRESIALELATARLESLLSQSTDTISAADNSTENLTQNGIAYTRTTTITVNADSSRTITVSVSGDLGKGGDVTVSSVASLWGNT